MAAYLACAFAGGVAAILLFLAWQRFRPAPDPARFERHNEPGATSSDRTDECSFLLRPSPFGVGVFAVHEVAIGTVLRLYPEEPDVISYYVKPDQVPGEFVKFCIDAKDGTLIRPMDFGRMELVWFLNHSSKPNASHSGDYIYRAVRHIRAGEEILIDYDTL